MFSFSFHTHTHQPGKKKLLKFQCLDPQISIFNISKITLPFRPAYFFLLLLLIAVYTIFTMFVLYTELLCAELLSGSSLPSFINHVD